MKAYTRSKPVKNIQYLSAQSKHARREDKTSDLRVRDDAERGMSLSWTFDDGPKPEFLPRTAADKKQPDYLSAFKTFKRENGVGERKGAQMGLHLFVGVSPEWVKEGGDPHDPQNPRNQQLMKAAVDWANTWSNGVYAARLDLDESGSSVVDLFIAPVRDQKHKNGSSKPVVSVNKALEELSIEHFGKRSKHYSALNSSWSEYAALHLDPRLQRGDPKEETQRKHVPPDEYRELMQQASKALEAAEIKEAEADKRLKQIDAEVSKRIETEVGTKVERIADLTARALAGVGDGSTHRTPDGKWSLNLNATEAEELRPFFKKISPALKSMHGLFEGVRTLFNKLEGIFKEQAEAAIVEEDKKLEKLNVFSLPVSTSSSEREKKDVEGSSHSTGPSGP